jgi:hypothetical protein
MYLKSITGYQKEVQMNEVDPLRLTVDQLARRWQKSHAWIYNNYRRIGLKALHIGQHLRFPLEEVLNWEKRNTS